MAEHNPAGDARHHHGRLQRHATTIHRWLSTRDATNTPAPPRRDVAQIRRTKDQVSDPTHTQVAAAHQTITRITDTLTTQHGHIWDARCRRYGDDLPPPPTDGAIACAGIITASTDLLAWVIEGYRAGMETDELRSAVWAIGDCEHELHRLVAGYGMVRAVIRALCPHCKERPQGRYKDGGCHTCYMRTRRAS